MLLKWWRNRKRFDRDLDEEIQAHLAIEMRERKEAGQAADSARSAAIRDFGNVLLIKETTRDMSAMRAFNRFVDDLRLGLRLIGRHPRFALAVVLILALGIGANSAVFALIDAVVLKSLPVRTPEQLVCFRDPSFSYPTFQEVKTRSAETLSGLFAWTINTVNVEWNRDPQLAPALFVTGEFYSVLGVEPSMGRVLNAQDDVTGAALVAVISHDCWERRFDRDPAIVGKTIRIERTPTTIVGVAPPGFFGVAPGTAPEVTLSVTQFAKFKPQQADLRNLHMAWLHLMGRLKPGVSREAANAALRIYWPQVMEETTDPAMPPERRARFLGRQTELIPGHNGWSSVRVRFSEPLMILWTLVGLLLLVACASVANLLLVRSAARRREVAVRFALGASRGRVIRQLLTEGFVLSLLGAAGALLFANWGSKLLAELMATAASPISANLHLDWRMLVFTFACALATSLLFSLAPAVRATALDPGPALKESARGAAHGVGRWPLGRALVISQVTLAVLLLAGAALFGRSLRALVTQDAGFQPDKLLVIAIDGIRDRNPGPQLITFYSRLQDRVRAVPGVESVSLSYVPPVSNEMGGHWSPNVSIDGRPRPSTERTYLNVVSPSYFDTVGQRLLRGRDFGSQDREGSARTCIINESVARDFFADQDAIGRRISVGLDAARQNLEIVGIVRNAKYQRLQEPARRIAYLPYQQLPDFVRQSGLVAEVRAATTPAALIETLRPELQAFDPAAIFRFEPVSHRMRDSLVTERVVAIISAFLGGTALVLASIGLYGLLAFTVSRRTSEIGIRIALGASRGTVAWMVLRDSILLIAIGLAAGLLAAFGLSRFTANLIHGVTATDPIALIAAAVLMSLVAVAASLIPARRAANVDPIVALRDE